MKSSTTVTARPMRRRLTEQEAAEFLGLSVRTLQAWRIRGGGPGFAKFGRAVRYDSETLEAWADACTRSSTTDAG